jgi:hypothetical protein
LKKEQRMTSLKEEVVDKILSFSYEELEEWIHSRLQGHDKYFPLLPESELNTTQFLVDSFRAVNSEKSRKNFIKILYSLINQLKHLSGKEIEESKDYISKLLLLCGKIKQFKNKNPLVEIAVSGKFKGINPGGSDLHTRLLMTMSSYEIVGTREFWLGQFLDNSNKYYAYPAFFALSNYPDLLFDHIAVYIDKFKGETELIWAIMLLIEKYGIEEIAKRFNFIGPKLSLKQKETVDWAFSDAGYDPIYKPGRTDDDCNRLKNKFASPRIQRINMSNPGYESISLEKEAGRIFKAMGYEVEYNRCFAGHQIDVFIKRKKIIGDKYECWVCCCDNGNQKVKKNAVDRLYHTWNIVKKELAKESNLFSDCQAVFISSMALSIRKVVFATFDENALGVDPFKKYNLDDIVNMLALDTSRYKENKPLGAVKIRYKNKEDVIKRFPVFTDAGWNDRFYPAKKNDNYGRTKPLNETFKGMPEIVHENMQLAKVIVEIDFLEMEEGK